MARQVLGIFALILSVLGVFGSPMNVNFDDSDERIVGGVNAVPNQRPFQVSLKLVSTDSHFCGGAIIGDRWVITVAYCVIERKPASFYIMAGTIKLDVGGTKYLVQRSIPHPSYNPLTGENDIAMLQTAWNMAINSPNIKIVPILFNPVPSKETVIVSGWGLTNYPGSGSNVLQVLSTLTMDNTVCENLLKPTGMPVFPSEMCTMTKVEQGVCYGDIGSPVTHKNQLVGLVSRGIPCGQGYPDVSTGIPDHAVWILMTKFF